MSASPDLEFRKLVVSEAPLAVSLAASVGDMGDPRCEAWGLDPSGAPPSGGETWGLFMKGTLAGAVWLHRPETDVLEISGVALPRRRWGMGLILWMVDELVQKAAEGCREIVVNLDNGGPSLGETLEDARFTGPPPGSPGYPRGEWRRGV